MSSQLQPSLAGLTGMARRLVSEGVLPEADVRKAVADSAQQKVSLAAWLLDHGLVESPRLTQVASAEFGMPMMDVSTLSQASMPINLISEARAARAPTTSLVRSVEPSSTTMISISPASRWRRSDLSADAIVAAAL